MHKSVISLIFIAILLGGIIVSTALVAEPSEDKIPLSSPSERIVRIQLTLREIVKTGELPEGQSLVRTVIDSIREGDSLG